MAQAEEGWILDTDKGVRFRRKYGHLVAVGLVMVAGSAGAGKCLIKFSFGR